MGKPRRTKVLFLAPYPFGRVGSQRFRFEQYWDVLSEKYELSFQSFLSEDSFNYLYREGFWLRKICGVLAGFARRFLILFRVPFFNFIFIHREASPLGPPVIEWIICRVFRKKIIYDFDDAIWLSNTSDHNSYISLLKCSWKVKYICGWSWRITCGNHFLAEFAQKYCDDVRFLPTTLDLEKLPLPGLFSLESDELPVIGWTGTHSTLPYLHHILPVLQKLEQIRPFRFLVIADRDPRLLLDNYIFRQWNKETEWQDLNLMDIGIMPLKATEWEEGKCGFKALQYMALGIPALASPTGANTRIISDGVSGFICHSNEEWEQKLLMLLNNVPLGKMMSKVARLTVENHYSKKAWMEEYINLFITPKYYD